MSRAIDLACRSVAAWLILLIPITSLATDIRRENFRASDCNIRSMDVRFILEETFGEPVLSSRMRWSAGPNTAANCLGENTHLWLSLRTKTDQLRYVRVAPSVTQSGEDFGRTNTQSPAWGTLFCMQPNDRTDCEQPEVAKTIMADTARFDSFTVITEARSFAGVGSSAISSSPSTGNADVKISIEDRLTSVIDSALNKSPGEETAEFATSAGGEPSQIELGSEPELTNEVSARPTMEELLKQQADSAASNVLAIFGSKLANYSTPASECESSRTIANWAQSRGECKLFFKNEARHRYLCNDNGIATNVLSSAEALLDFAADIEEIEDIRRSEEGWVSLVLLLRQDKASSQADFNTKRWQITTPAENVEDLSELASSFLTLQNWCEAKASAG